MRLIRTDLAKQRMARKLIADKPAMVACNKAVAPEGITIETRLTIQSDDMGTIYAVVLTDDDLELIRATRSTLPRARRKNPKKGT
jgi:hypothetical protein